MEVYRVKTGSILPLGKQGENMARKIQFDISRWIGTFGPGTVQLLHQRSGDNAPYPVAVEQEGNLAVWTVTNADTAAAGTGRAELQYYVGDALAKSETWMTKVLAALGPASETPPEAQQGWVDQVLAQVAKITGMTAQAVELPAGSAPTADYADGVLTIGIPLGGDVSEAQIAQAVAEYLSNNPIAETDPTVPDWAKAKTKPAYTATEVGADPAGTATARVSAHNTAEDSHRDIRLLIQGLTTRFNSLADSDDTTLDQLSEIVAYIKSNRKLIEAITTSKVSVGDIVNDLVTNVANKPLSAAQGVALKAMIDAITIPTALPNPNALTFTGSVSGSYDGSAPFEVNIPSGGGGITVTNTAAVGQTVKITAVDENGQPTEWEAVDMAGKVQPDWNQNDSNASDYVKNRTHYEESTYVDYVLNTSGTSIVGLSMPEVGETITVKINGVESAETVKEAESGLIGVSYKYIGNIDFDSLTSGGTGWCVAEVQGHANGLANPDTTITIETIVVHKINNKFINFDGFARTFDYYFKGNSNIYKTLYKDDGNKCVLYVYNNIILPESGSQLLGFMGEVGFSKVESTRISSCLVTGFIFNLSYSEVVVKNTILGTDTSEMEELAAEYGYVHTTNPNA